MKLFIVRCFTVFFKFRLKEILVLASWDE